MKTRVLMCCSMAIQSLSPPGKSARADSKRADFLTTARQLSVQDMQAPAAYGSVPMRVRLKSHFL